MKPGYGSTNLLANAYPKRKKARLTGGPKAREERENQIGVEEAMRIGARIFAGAQKTLLSIKTQLMLPCWLSSTGWRLFSVVTRALSQAVTARQGNVAAINSLFRVVVMIRVLLEVMMGPLYFDRFAAHQELLGLPEV